MIRLWYSVVLWVVTNDGKVPHQWHPFTEEFVPDTKDRETYRFNPDILSKIGYFILNLIQNSEDRFYKFFIQTKTTL